MKTTTLLIVFLTIVSISRGQSSAVCIYKVFNNKDNGLQIMNDDDAIAQDTKNMLSYALELAKDFNYILKFNTSESIFRLDELILNEASESNYLYPISKALVGEGVYYQNKSTNESSRQVETMGKVFIIKDILLDDWKITDEKKELENITV
jgi:GLPGLI family protein